VGDEGGTAGILLTCPRDGVDTRLQCAECSTPICPACYVRTSVGFRCEDCGAASGPCHHYRPEARPRWHLVAAVAAAAVVLGAVVLALVGDSGGPDADQGVEPAAARPELVVGTGQLPNGAPWRLAARRDGDLCTTLSVGGSPGPERCEPLVPGRHLIRMHTAGVRAPTRRST